MEVPLYLPVACPMRRLPALCTSAVSGGEQCLDHAVLLRLEGLVCLGALFQWQPVGGEAAHAQRVGVVKEGEDGVHPSPYGPSAELDTVQFQLCDCTNSKSRWITTLNDDSTVRIQSADGPTQCLFRSGPAVRLLARDTPATQSRTPNWTLQLKN